MRHIFIGRYLFLKLFIVFLCSFESTVYSQSTYIEIGIASYYHDMFVGRKTATGEIYSQEKMTAAHKSLPLNSWVKVTNLQNDSMVILRINDRMPLWNKRSIDLTEAAAKKLNYIHAGLTKVKIEVIPDPTKKGIKKFVIDTNQVVVKMELKRLKLFEIKDANINLKYPQLIYLNIPELTFKEKLSLLISKEN